MASVTPDPPTRPHPSSVERRSRGKWLQTAPQEEEPKTQEPTSQAQAVVCHVSEVRGMCARRTSHDVGGVRVVPLSDLYSCA